MKKVNTDYVLCSLSLIRKLHINPVEAINDLLINGIDNYAGRINADLPDIINAIIYDYYNDDLNSYLITKFETLIANRAFTPDSVFRGFYSGEFEPEFERNELIDICHNDPSFERDLTTFYQLVQASEHLKIPIDKETILSDIFRVRKQIKSFEEKFGTDATFMVGIKTLFSFKNNDKSKFEYQLLTGFLSIKSLEGKGKFCCTVKANVLMRMLGAKSIRVLEDSLRHPAIKVVYENYLKRYQFDKLIDNLLMSNFISSRKGNKENGKSRLYISCQLTKNELMQIITEKNSLKRKRLDR